MPAYLLVLLFFLVCSHWHRPSWPSEGSLTTKCDVQSWNEKTFICGRVKMLRLFLRTVKIMTCIQVPLHGTECCLGCMGDREVRSHGNIKCVYILQAKVCQDYGTCAAHVTFIYAQTKFPSSANATPALVRARSCVCLLKYMYVSYSVQDYSYQNADDT